MHRNLLIIGLVASLQSVVAQSTSLFIPGFDPQPISADIVGVDSSGHTTWALQPGSVTDDADQGFVGTVTLVEGSSDAHLTYADTSLSLTLGYDCTFSSDQAICSGVADGTFVETETISSFAVALGTSTVAEATSVPNSVSKSGTSTSAAPSQTEQSNSSPRQVAASCVPFLVFGTGVVNLVLSLL